MLTVAMIEKTEYAVGDFNRQEAIKIYSCPACGNKVEPYHRFCWYCGQSLKKPEHKEEKRDACEIHHSGEPQLPELLTYGKNARFIEPRTR